MPPNPPTTPNPLTNLFAYSDWANAHLCALASPLSDQQLDQDLQLGPGSLRRILQHIDDAEAVWLQRWTGAGETPWPKFEPRPPQEIAARLASTAAAREDFLATLDPARLAARQGYRDSKGARYTATLLDMLLQGVTHSTHHRAQAANAFRRLGLPAPELDYMYHVRARE